MAGSARKIIPNGTIMRWKFNRNHDIYLTVRVIEKLPRAKGQWQRYKVIVEDTYQNSKYKNKVYHAPGNRLFDPVPKFNTIEEAEAWLEQQH